MARYNYRLAKINRSYTITELADLFVVHKQTVSNWIKAGLHVCCLSRPILVRGSDVREFLQKKQSRNKKTCLPGQIYCVACKLAQYPKERYALLNRQTDLVGDLIGECPSCGTTVHRKVSLRKICDWKGDLILTEMKDESLLSIC